MIEVQKVSLQIKKAKILENVDFTCQKGQICGVVGRNGSGKTMLMKCICGFVKPTSGEIQVDGQVIGKDIDFIPNAGIIIETPGFIPNYSGYKNLQLLASIQNRIDIPL